MISAEVICDSVSEQDKRLTTFKLRYPKFIHGEFMTHRVISRNASSSRAIPTTKLLEEVRSNELRAGPVFWGKNQPGMQAAEELEGIDLIQAKNIWADAALFAADQAERMLKRGAHKQIVNRLLEPFSHINVVATATEWDNFFGLRLHKDAQPEMRALAIGMWEAIKASTPQDLKLDEWHLPFTDDAAFDDAAYEDRFNKAVKVSIARCARVSYETFETGKRSTVEDDIKLYERLATSGHWSPFEHQATPDRYDNPKAMQKFWRKPYLHGNLVGWIQKRKVMPGEDRAPIPEEFQTDIDAATGMADDTLPGTADDWRNGLKDFQS